MMGLTILPKKYYDILDTQTALLASIASKVGDGGIEITRWKDLQRITRMGLADKILTVGDQFLTTYGSNDFVLDVIGINRDTPTDKRFEHSITLQFHDCICNAQFSAPQALYYAEDGLAAGNYNFVYNDKSYQFTLALPIPKGGQVTFPWAYDTNILTTKISTFASSASTAPIESNLAVTEGNGGTTLTPLNHMDRCRYGSNNYMNSVAKQWLNSSASTFAWVPKTIYDRPSTGAPYTGAGFLQLLDPDLVDVLGAVDKVVALNTITDGGGSDTVSDKVFLLSRSEVYAGLENSINEGAPYPYYSALASAATSGALAGRIKYLSGSARSWWLRSPSSGYALHVRLVPTAGELDYYYASSACGVAPACCIV